MANVSVIGLGKLGLPLAMSLVSRDFRVVGVDADPGVRQLANGKIPMRRVWEPGLENLLESAGDNFIAISSIGQAVHLTKITIVMVNTPSEPDGGFSLEHVKSVCRPVGDALANKSDYHLVIISSTVMPGSCGGPVKEILERQSGKEVGSDFGLCYCPEFGALGNILRGFLEPDFVIMGVSDERAGNVAEGMYDQLCVNNPPIFRTNLINAELAKISVNCYVAMKITFANQLAELCEQVPGANVDEVTSAMGWDSRIGPKFLTGATAFGGPCFPRDIQAMTRASGKVGMRLPLITEIGRMNRWQVDRLAWLVHKHWERIGAEKVGVLGLAYKPGVPSTENSAGMALIDLLYPKENVVAFDPAVRTGWSVRTAQICVDAADIVVIATPWPEFKEVVFHKGQVVIDCWRLLDRETVVRQGAEYVAIGVGPCE